ncbi:MAG: hypothetical protein KJO07_17695 [Deltaproteobacteria bacterium]|nr:hypothetical protein [Deltaproteobacteria bacterium]
MRTSAAVLAVAGLLVSHSHALAEPAGVEETEDARSRAKELYLAGLEHYRNGDFPRAAATLKRSYEIYPAPQLLFNLGQATRRGGKLSKALAYYRAFLRDAAGSRHVVTAERHIADIELALTARDDSPAQDQPQAAESTQAATVVPPATPQSNSETASLQPARIVPVRPPLRAWKPAPEVDDDGVGLRAAGLTVGSAGLALLGTGLYFGLSARSASSQIESLSEDRGQWSPAQLEIYERGERDERLAWILAGTGAAATATGVVLYLFGRQAPSDLVVSTTGRTLAVGARF